MFRKLSLFVGLVVGVAFLASCKPWWNARDSYFDGAVAVEYKKKIDLDVNDSVTFRFYKEGTYEVLFSLTPGIGGSGLVRVPRDFKRIILDEDVPYEIVIEKYSIPDFLRITITKDGKSEAHDLSPHGFPQKGHL